jgi:hypothetical protein
MRRRERADSRRARERVTHLLDALGFHDEVTVQCVDRGDTLLCQLEVASGYGHYFVYRFWDESHTDWASLGQKAVAGAEQLLEQREQMLLGL